MQPKAILIHGNLPFLAVLMILLTGCSEPPRVERNEYPLPEDVEISSCEPGRYGGVFVLTEATEPKTFNFLVPADAASSSAQSRFLAGLTSYDPISQSVIPALAKSWEMSEDRKDYTFHLRRGVKWSDGEPSDADDVIFTFDCIFAMHTDPQTGKQVPRFPNRYIEQYTIGGERITYEKIDSHTVRFHTPKLYSPFINDIGFVPVIPEHKLRTAFEDGTLMKQWSSQTAIDHPEELVGTGPFTVFSYTPGERIVFKANPHFWRADSEGKRLPYVDFLVNKFVADNNTQTLLFATGQTDAAGIPATDIAWVRKAEEAYDFTLHERGPSPSISFLWFNQNTGRNKEGESYIPEHKLAWFTNKHFRQAVMYGFDREGIVEGVYLGRAEPLHSVISQGNPKWHNPNTHRYRYDPKHARTLLSQAGFRWNESGRLIDSQGHEVSFELMIFAGSANARGIATTFQQNMRALGMEVRIASVDFAVILQRTDNTFDYDMAMIGWGSSAGASDPSGSKALYLSSGIYHVWHPEQETPVTDWETRVDSIIEEQERTFDEQERIALFHELQEIFAEELPLIYLVTPIGYSGIKNKWRNVQVPPSGTILWNLDELWTETPYE